MPNKTRTYTAIYHSLFTSEQKAAFLRASALGAERVNGLWLSNAGGGAVNLLSRTFVNIAHRGYEDDGT